MYFVTKLIKFIVLGSLGLMFAFSFLNLGGVQAVAADTYAYAECKKTSINLSNLFVITKNVPIIPADCSQNADGTPRPLSPSLLGDVAVRAYAFLVSLGFTIITPSLVGMGFLWIYSGIDEAQAAFVKKWSQNLAVGLVLMLFAYVVPFTLMSVLKISPSVTNLDNFFSF